VGPRACLDAMGKRIKFTLSEIETRPSGMKSFFYLSDDMFTLFIAKYLHCSLSLRTFTTACIVVQISSVNSVLVYAEMNIRNYALRSI
jgi:hypothetical protein